MGYAKQEGESTEQYVDRIRSEAASGSISSGPGGSLIQQAIDRARGFDSSSHAAPGSSSQAVADQFYNEVNSGKSGIYNAANKNQPIYGSQSGGMSEFAPIWNTSGPTTAGGAGGTGSAPTAPYNANVPDINPTNPTNSGQNPGQIFTPGIDPSVFERGRQDILYNLQNPEFALQNALRAKGVNLYNPIIRRAILPAAQGLGSAYTISGAMNPESGPSTDMSGGFANFIQSALSGAGGGIRGAMSGALGNLGNLGGVLQNAANAQQANQVPNNPFIGALLSTLYDPTALTGLQTSLALPMLGAGLTSGLQELLGLKSAAAWNQIQPSENFYKYLSP